MRLSKICALPALALAGSLLAACGGGGDDAPSGGASGEGTEDGVGALRARAVVLATGGMGQLYASTDEGESWRRITPDLPPISSVSAAVLE